MASRTPWWQLARAVAWSLLGLRRGSGLDEDSRLNPVQVIIAGLVALVLFVLALMLLVHWIV